MTKSRRYDASAGLGNPRYYLLGADMKWEASVVSLFCVAGATVVLPYQAWTVLARYEQIAARTQESPHRAWFDAAHAVIQNSGTVLSLPIALWGLGSGLMLLIWVWDGLPPKAWTAAQTAATSASGACAVPLAAAALAQLGAALSVMPYHYRNAAAPGACLVGNQFGNAMHAASVSAAFAPIGVIAAVVAWSCVRMRRLDGSQALAAPWPMQARWHRVSRAMLVMAGGFFAWVYISRVTGSALWSFAFTTRNQTPPDPLSVARWMFVSPLVELELTITVALLLVMVLGVVHTALVTMGLFATPRPHDPRVAGHLAD